MHISASFSIISERFNYSNTFNGWDRHRLGWKHPASDYFISARTPGYNEIQGDLDYAQQTGTDTIILRDFVTYGDAVRIKLPYLKTIDNNIHPQYLWIENRQSLPGNQDFSPNEANGPGIYSYIQIGKDDTAGFGQNSNYLKMLCALGNYDFGEGLEDGTYNIRDDFANPFTGNNLLEIVHADLPPNDSTAGDGIIRGNELIEGSNVILNGDTLSESYFDYLTYPRFGSEFDQFDVGDAIAIDENPSVTPLIVYETKSGSPNPSSQDYDNRTIHLNGLSIEVLEEVANANGDGNDVKVVIRWNNFNIEKNVRWCGPIHLHDSLTVKAGKEIVLDQGLTPTKPVNPIDFNGEKVFADPTVMRVRSGSEIYLENHGCIRIKNGSTLLLEENSSIRLADSALIVIDSTGILDMRSNHITLADPDARIVVKPGGIIKTADGVNFTFSGSGYLELHEHAQIDLGQDSRFQLYGQGEDERMLVLKEGADINIGSHHMVLKRGKILSHTNSELSLSDSTLYIHKCTFSNAVDGVQGGTGIEVTALARARVAQSNFIGLEKAVELLNADSTTGNTYNIVGCEFLENDYSVWLKDNKRKVSILGSDIICDRGDIGIYAENSPLLEFYGSEIDNAFYGMAIADTLSFNFTGGNPYP